MKLPHRPSHGVIAGYAGLLLGTLAVAGAPAMAAGLINGKTIKKGTVTSAKLAKSSVTASKIRTGAVTRTKLARGSVTGAAIAAGAVDGARVKDLSLGVADLSLAARAALRGGPVGASSVTTATIASGAVTTEKLAAGAVTTAAVADGTITKAKLAEGAVSGSKIPAHVVSLSQPVAFQSVGVATASCAAGEQALGGAVAVDAAAFPLGGLVPVVTISAPIFGADGIPTGWTAEVNNPDTTIPADFTVYAICA